MDALDRVKNEPGQDIDAYSAFQKRFGIVLNEQQERAVRAVDGANLLLAVPGSGKTTVLVARLGFLIACKGVRPEHILALTFSKDAARDMQRRFFRVFRGALGRVEFRTINAIANEMVVVYAQRTGRPKPRLVEDNKKIVTEILRKYLEEYPTDVEIADAQTAIGYIKNMAIPVEEISDCDFTLPEMDQIFTEYQTTLKTRNLMDFDDQVEYALRLLKKLPWLLEMYRQRFTYFCVDEAQDTSKIQHELLRVLVGERGNVFMVGDEDQSIYRFRGAFPQALMEFNHTYADSNVMWMETNYRSTPEIVDVANRFIAKNRDRYPKKMVAHRGGGDEVDLVVVESRQAQYEAILDVAREVPTDTAVIYRENDAALPLLYLLSKHGIPYRCSQTEFKFFGNKVVLDVMAFLRLQQNPKDVDAFQRICYKGGFFLDKKTVEYACSKVARNEMTILRTLKEFAKRNRRIARAVMAFEEHALITDKMNALEFLEYLESTGYGTYMEENHLDGNKLELLQALAHDKPTVPEFLTRLEELRHLMADNRLEGEAGIILTTAHSSKGLEYDTVYLIDVYNGQFPGTADEQDDMETYQEERRLFYVAMTRAKNHLHVMTIKGRMTTFGGELHMELRKREMDRLHKERLEQEAAERMEQARKKAQAEQAAYLARYEEVRGLFVQQSEPIYDSTGKRWVRCELCGAIKESDDFSSYGGRNHVNLGECSRCIRRMM